MAASSSASKAAAPGAAGPSAAAAAVPTSTAETAHRSSPIDWLLFFLLGAIWGSSFLFIKIGDRYFGPLEVVSFRLLFGATTLAVIIRLAGQALPRGRVWAHLLVLAVFNVVVPFSLITWGETTIDSGVASILNATMPLFTIIVAGVVIGEAITVNRLAGLLVGFAGVVIVVSRNVGGGHLAGQLAVAAAACSYACATVYARRHVRHLRPMVLAMGQVGLALPIVATMALVAEHPWTVPLRPEPILATLWLGALGSAIAYLISFRLLIRWDATRASLVTYLLPIVGVGLGAIVLGEQVDGRVILGTALVVGGVALVNARLRTRVLFGTRRAAAADLPASSTPPAKQMADAD